MSTFIMYNIATAYLTILVFGELCSFQNGISRNFWLCVCINRGFDLYRN